MAAKKPKAKRERKPKTKQGYLDPAMEPPCVPAIDSLADLYMEKRDERMAALKEEVELNDQLDKLMKDNRLTVYEYNGKVVTVNTVEKVKVSKKKTATIGGVDGEFIGGEA